MQLKMFDNFNEISIKARIELIQIEISRAIKLNIKENLDWAYRYFEVDKLDRYDRDEIFSSYMNFLNGLTKKECKVYYKALKVRAEFDMGVKFIERYSDLDDYRHIYAFDAIRIHDAKMNNRSCKIRSNGDLLIDRGRNANHKNYDDEANITNEELEGLDEYY